MYLESIAKPFLSNKENYRNKQKKNIKMVVHMKKVFCLVQQQQQQKTKKRKKGRRNFYWQIIFKIHDKIMFDPFLYVILLLLNSYYLNGIKKNILLQKTSVGIKETNHIVPLTTFTILWTIFAWVCKCTMLILKQNYKRFPCTFIKTGMDSR